MPYLAHFGLEEHPFTLTPDVEYFFPTEEHANIIASVEFALKRDTGIIKVVGEVGTGKTLLCRMLIKKLIDNEAVAYINAPRASANSILLGVCHEFGVEGADNPDTAYTALNKFLVEEHAKGRMAVVVVDEAQHLGREGLELIRLISNLETEKRKLLQIVLFGQTELDELLSDPSMRQLNQRIAFSLGTKPLSVDESQAYVAHRLRVSRRAGVVYEVFSSRALDLLARSCGGIPRVLNIVADKSLLAAFADGAAVVQPKHVAEALKESGALVRPVNQNRRSIGRIVRRTATYAAAAVALVLLAVIAAAVVPSGEFGQRVRSLWHTTGALPAASPAPVARSTDTPAAATAAPAAVATDKTSVAPPPSPSPAPAATTAAIAPATAAASPAIAPTSEPAATTPTAATLLTAPAPNPTVVAAPVVAPAPAQEATTPAPLVTVTPTVASPAPEAKATPMPADHSADAASASSNAAPSNLVSPNPSDTASAPKPELQSSTPPTTRASAASSSTTSPSVASAGTKKVKTATKVRHRAHTKTPPANKKPPPTGSQTTAKSETGTIAPEATGPVDAGAAASSPVQPVPADPPVH